jgi:hypothetical protein
MADELRSRLETMLDASRVRYRWLPKGRASGRGKHRAIELHTGDQTRRFFLPCTPSDRRAVANAVAMVKRALKGSP